jgi:hypothetical protein
MSLSPVSVLLLRTGDAARRGIPDPAATVGREAERRLPFRDAFRMVDQRTQLFQPLPVPCPDRMEPEREANAIGHPRSGTAEGLAS